jgi:hypothetical protein
VKKIFAGVLVLYSVITMSCDIEDEPGGVNQPIEGVESGNWLETDGGTGTPRDQYDTAAGEHTRLPGYPNAGEQPFTEWPPKWSIAVSFPASQYTPGFLGLNGHGTVKETKWSQLEKDIIWEINKFRADPVAWCNANGLSTLDGISAQAEFIGNQNGRPYNFPAQKLSPSAGLHKAALHQSLFGNAAHSDVSRVKVYVGFSAWAENVGGYSDAGAASIVARFVRDSSDSGKLHRINMANPGYTRAGIACYNNIIVMQFGDGISEKNP